MDRFEEIARKIVDRWYPTEVITLGSNSSSAMIRKDVADGIAKEIVKALRTAVEDEQKKYRPFLNWLFSEVFEGSPDGGDIQDKAEEMGLLVLCKVPEEERANYQACEEYDTDEIYFPFWFEEAKKWAIRPRRIGKGE